jgi:DTW domain-containing protein YfiP
LIPEISVQTRVIVLMHFTELKLTTNTARLASRALAGSEVRVRGRLDEPLSTEGIRELDRESLLLFPTDDAVELNPEFVASLEKRVTLIVPDGSWRQARKTVSREPGLLNIRRVKLPLGRPSEYRLRNEPHAHSVCTFEAIARFGFA